MVKDKKILFDPYKVTVCQLSQRLHQRKIGFLLKTSLLLFFLLFYISTFSNRGNFFQNSSINQVGSLLIDWKLDHTIGGVEFYHAIAECGGKKVVFLKMNNKKNYKVNVSWKEVFTTEDNIQVEGAQGQKNILLSTGENMEMSCDNISRKELIIFPEQVDPTYIIKILKFNYKNIMVSKAR